MKILVTGSNGLAGKEISTYLKNKGYDTIGVARRSGSENEQDFVLDLSQPDLDLSAVIKKVDAVVHTAAVVPRKDITNSEANAQIIQTIDLNVARFCEKHDIPVVYFSSCPLYDLMDPSEKTEDATITPRSPYHAAKERGEQLFGRQKKTVVARLSSPYGVHSDPDTVLKLFLSKAFQNEKIFVHSSGNREQDFIHVRDIACFVEAAFVSGQTGIFNLAYGKPVTMKELAALSIKICNKGQLEMDNQKDPAGNFYARYSIEKARRILNWQPMIPLAEGLQEILRMWKNA